MIVFAESFGLLHWLESSGMALSIRQSTWLYPIVEIVHIIGFAVLVGSAFLFDLRLLGLARKLPVTECIRHMIFWARISLIAVLPSGFILFMVDAVSLASNPAFLIKLFLIALAGMNAAVFHLRTVKSVERWDVLGNPPVGAKVAGMLSILLWIGVISGGRLIAYI
jgi:hypothetical protein